MNFHHPSFQLLELRVFLQTFFHRLFLPWQVDHLHHHHLRRNPIHLNSLRHLQVPLPPKDIDIYYKINRTIYFFSKVILMRAHFENSCNQFQMGFEINIKKDLWWWWPLSRSISFGRTTSPFWRRNHFGFFYLLTILPKSKAKLSCQWQFDNSTRQLSVSREKLSWAKLNQAKLRKSAQYICTAIYYGQYCADFLNFV